MTLAVSVLNAMVTPASPAVLGSAAFSMRIAGAVWFVSVTPPNTSVTSSVGALTRIWVSAASPEI